MSLVQFLGIIWARRLLVLVSLFSCVCAAFFVSQLLPERYEARSRLMLDVVKPDPVTGEVIASQFAKAYTKTQIELIRDYRVAGQVVDALGMEKDPELREAYEAREGAANTPFRRWLAERIMANSEARLIEGSNILEITAKASNPETARRMADALRQAYVNASLGFRKEGARRSADFYNTQTEKARLALAQAEEAKTRFERQNGLILEAGTDLDSARLQALAGAPPVAATTPVIGGGSPASAAQLAQAEAALAQASKTLGPNHPEMQELQRRRAAAAALVSQERATSGAAAAAANRAAGATSAAATQAYQSQRARVIGNRDKVERLRQLQTDLDIKREQYAKTSSRAAELRQQAEVSESGLTLLGSAIAPERPASPNRPLILGLAAAFGLALGVLLAILTELFDRRVRSIDDIARGFDVPLIGVIPSPAHARSGDLPLLGHAGQP